MCDLCAFASYRKKELVEHTSESHLKTEYSCDKCGEILSGVKACHNHRRWCHNENKFQCPKCEKDFEYNRKAWHIKRCQGDKIRVCDIEDCYYTTNNPGAFKTHMKMRVWYCDVAGCGKVFHGKRNLDAHKRNYLHQLLRSSEQHDSNGRQSMLFECGSCSYVTKFKTQLREHELTCNALNISADPAIVLIF